MFQFIFIFLFFVCHLSALPRPHRGGLRIQNGQRIFPTQPPLLLNANAKAYNYRTNQNNQQNNANNNNNNNNQNKNNEVMWKVEHRLNDEFEKLKDKQLIQENAAEQHAQTISEARRNRLSDSFFEALSKYSSLHKFVFLFFVKKSKFETNNHKICVLIKKFIVKL